MQKALLFKAAAIVVIFALLLVPLRMIGGIVAERAARQQAVVQELAASSYGKQVLAGPILTVSYVEQFEEEITDNRVRRIDARSVERVVRFFPAVNVFEGAAVVDVKTRGLFKARVFEWRGSARGEFIFDGARNLPRSRPDSRIIPGAATISIVLGDPRGIVGTPELAWAGQSIRLERGSALPHLASGLHAQLPALDPFQPQRVGYALTLALHGTESLTLVPSADADEAHLTSNWPHASFGGQFLPRPESQRSSSEGFDARWSVSAMASQAQAQFLAAIDGAECRAGSCADRIDVRFVDPIDIYALSDRALKYAFLFVGFTFGCFVLFEVLKALRIHPAQYFLVGLALATFFLLLIALSEHIAFWMAYVVASTACVALLAFYLSAVLGGAQRGLSFAAVLTALYSALYVVLIAEDTALLLGSMLVFALVAAALVTTRRVDWYSLRPAPGRPDPAPSPRLS